MIIHYILQVDVVRQVGSGDEPMAGTSATAPGLEGSNSGNSSETHIMRRRLFHNT